jgi:hypothetical protein
VCLRRGADAQEQAECTNADLLNHRRQPGVHFRACWVLDWLLGKELSMNDGNPSPLEVYESRLGEITHVCADPWFTEQMAHYRAGDEAAWRRISGSCLGRVHAIVKKHWQPNSSTTLLDAVQEGNAALVTAVKRFSGTTADEFLREMTAKVEHGIVLFLQHPDQP